MKRVCEGKAPREDELIAEVIKYCDVSDIQLFAYKLLMNGQKPEQFIILEEAEVAMKQVCEGKAPREDELIAEVIKYCDVSDMQLFAYKLLMNGQKPEQFIILEEA